MAVQGLITTFVADLKRHRIEGAHDVALATANLLLRFVSAARWNQTSELITQVRALGRTLIQANPREIACGNVVRRVLNVIREVGEGEYQAGGNKSHEERKDSPLMASMFNLLSTEENKTKIVKHSSKDEKADIIEGIQELIDEIDNMDDTIAGMSLDMIHENEILLTPTPGSRTVRDFLIRAAQKRKFSILVTETFPNEVERAHLFAKELSKAGIETIVIPDTTVHAVMSRVGKVIIGASTVLANGGCISSSGVSLVCECAKEHRTPVLAVTGLYKLSPQYPFDIESLIEVGDSSKVISFEDSEIMDKLEVMNPTSDYVSPDHIDIYITNV